MLFERYPRHRIYNCSNSAKFRTFTVIYTGRKNGFSHIANVEQMHGKCYVCACLLRFAEKATTHGNARKCHICFKFAVVSKSMDNMVFSATFGGVVNMMLKLKFCKYFS